MVRDEATGKWRIASTDDGANSCHSTALAHLSDADQALVTEFESEGGLALALSSAFSLPDRLRREAQRVLAQHEEGGEPAGSGTEGAPDQAAARELDEDVAGVLRTAGLDVGAELLEGASEVGRAIFMLQAADMAEEREAVMRNVWADVEFHGGDMQNAELVSRLERQFATQLARTTNARKATEQAAAQEGRQGNQEEWEADIADEPTLSEHIVAEEGNHWLAELAPGLPEQDLTASLHEPRNLGVALDLIGVYLKNYEIDKADMVITRILPLCRQRGGTWLCKGLDKLSAIRMKQFRAQDALVALKEIKATVPFSPEEGWEFHEILYRNLAWCYSSLGEAELCLDFTRRSVEVKRACGIPPTWFDLWDLAKCHSRLGQKTGQREEMRAGYDLCVKAGETIRVAEPSDRIMRAKILSNVGEIAMGMGDSYHLEGGDSEAREWYAAAEPSLLESFELYLDTIGPNKPLSGWAAGTVAHCMVRLERWEDARDYLTTAWRVECSKDSTTPGSVIELLDRVLGVQQQLDDTPGMSRYVEDLELALSDLRARGWHRRERDIFALLLQKASTAILLADQGNGQGITRALKLLKEAQGLLAGHLRDSGSDAAGSGSEMPEGSELKSLDSELGEHWRDADEKHNDKELPDVAPKRFGPQCNPQELLEQVQTNIRLLELAEAAYLDADTSSSFEDTTTPIINTSEGLGSFEMRRGSWPFCTQLRHAPTASQEDAVFLPDVLVGDGETVDLKFIDETRCFGYVSNRQSAGWVQLKYLIGYS